jgi:hypothetical protein
MNELNELHAAMCQAENEGAFQEARAIRAMLAEKGFFDEESNQAAEIRSIREACGDTESRSIVMTKLERLGYKVKLVDYCIALLIDGKYYADRNMSEDGMRCLGWYVHPKTK